MPRDGKPASAPAHPLRSMPPVLWLGAAILLASLAGCIWMIVIAAGDTDSEVTTRGTTILKVPVERTPLSAPTARGESAPR